ncbi:hypothetical protein TNCV_1859131 [Trichonephila clavipes]|nr:hypothetical protein TNCV_1859131 [Trichonephila clavipes]
MCLSPDIIEDHRIEGLMHIVMVQSLHFRVVWKLEEWGVVLVILPWFRMTRSFANNPRVALECDVAKHSLGC